VVEGVSFTAVMVVEGEGMSRRDEGRDVALGRACNLICVSFPSLKLFAPVCNACIVNYK
jgi:hypothetical protein